MQSLPQIRISKQIGFYLCVLMLLISCRPEVLYDQYQIIEHTVWEKDKEYYFTFMVDEIEVPYDLTLEIRNNNLYPYQNLWLFCNEEPPVGTLRRDTIECLLADDFGKWYGQGISLFQLSIPLKKNHYFTHKGQYTFSFKQGMRTDQLKGIQELGFRVSKSSIVPSSRSQDEEK